MVTFEQLGVDRLFVDEAHNYKKPVFIHLRCGMWQVLSTSDAQKSSDMFAKCRYMDETDRKPWCDFRHWHPRIEQHDRTLHHASGILQYDRLQELNMTHFDCWASRFGETRHGAGAGTGRHRLPGKNEIQQVFQPPELMNLFREVADIKNRRSAELAHPPGGGIPQHRGPAY